MASAEEVFATSRWTLVALITSCLTAAEDRFKIQSAGSVSSHDSAVDIERLYGAQKIRCVISADPKWQPIVTVTAPHSEPQQFILTPELGGFDKVREVLMDAVFAISTT